ncbi:KleE stable inheritance protein [Nitrosomonas halophila]|uniref:Protein kleE n=1 Tax=Nitrosomonas halophila TaxID=44576 RepID=A0A1H3KIK2_9PROT|nr:KleE stable inheritance protein [Nitrosomonas halophila]SDY51820.1 hypothetical protein SAMN05421881_104027 [Nitrosomonas halophila]
MSNIIKFPRSEQVEPVSPVPATSFNQDKLDKVSNTKGKAYVSGVLRFIWIAVVLVWPVLKWLVSIEVFFQFIRMIYHWNTSGVYAGWTFLLHFVALTTLTYFVSIYKPNGL